MERLSGLDLRIREMAQRIRELREITRFTVAEMVGLGRLLLAMLAFWGMFDTVNVIFLGALKGVGDTRFAMAWLLGTEWLLYVPAIGLTLLALDGGILSAWAVQLGYIVLLSTGLFLRWRRDKWMNIRLV